MNISQQQMESLTLIKAAKLIQREAVRDSIDAMYRKVAAAAKWKRAAAVKVHNQDTNDTSLISTHTFLCSLDALNHKKKTKWP